MESQVRIELKECKSKIHRRRVFVYIAFRNFENRGKETFLNLKIC